MFVSSKVFSNVLLSVATVLAAFPQVLRAAPNADELLRNYAESLGVIDRVKFNLLSKTYEQGGAFPERTWLNTTTATYVRIDGEWRYRFRSTGNSYHGHFIPYDQEYELLLDGPHYFIRREFETTGIIDEDDARLDASAANLSNVNVTYAESQGDSGKFLTGYARQNQTRVLNGYLTVDSYNRLPELMHEAGASLQAKTETIDGHDTHVITSRGRYGTHTVWLDPQSGYLPRRIRCVKRGSDLFANKPVGSIPARGDPEHRRPDLPMQGCDYEIDHIRIEPVNGRWVMTAYEERTIFIYEGDVQFVSSEEVELSEVDFDPDPDEDLRLTIAIPDGTRVAVTDGKQIDCEWRDGNVVKVVDKGVVTKLADLSFGPQPDNFGGSKKWLIIANGLFVVAFVGLLLIRRFRTVRK